MWKKEDIGLQTVPILLCNKILTTVAAGVQEAEAQVLKEVGEGVERKEEVGKMMGALNVGKRVIGLVNVLVPNRTVFVGLYTYASLRVPLCIVSTTTIACILLAQF